MALISGMAVAPINPGTIRKPPPMPKKPDSAPTAKPMPISNGNSRGMVSRVEHDVRIAARFARPQHRQADHHHQHAEQHQQAGAVHHLAELRAAGGADDAGQREHQRAGPFHRARPRVAGKIGGSAGGNRNRAGADGEVRGAHADHVDQERHRHDRAAAADQAERETDQAAGGDRIEARAGSSLNSGGAGHRDQVQLFTFT